MRVTVNRLVTHRCPHEDEIDMGELEASWDGDEIELHHFGHYLDTWAEEPVTHETMTERIGEYLNEYGASGVHIKTVWHTAGMTVTVTA